MERKYFKNQAEVYQALLDGKKISMEGLQEKQYFYLKYGFFVHEDGKRSIDGFCDPSIWYEYVEPVDESKDSWVEFLYPVARLNEQTKKVEWL